MTFREHVRHVLAIATKPGARPSLRDLEEHLVGKAELMVRVVTGRRDEEVAALKTRLAEAGRSAAEATARLDALRLENELLGEAVENLRRLLEANTALWVKAASVLAPPPPDPAADPRANGKGAPVFLPRL